MPVPGTPHGDERAPDELLRRVRACAARCVWHSESGVLTFAIDDARFLKWAPPGTGARPADEAPRLAWAGRFTPVPSVLDVDPDGSWLLTAALPGVSAVDARLLTAQAAAVRAIGRGLREFHDRLPVDACPFSWSVDARLAAAAADGLRIPAALRSPPPVDRLVVCHGDACAPNTIVGDDDRWVGHVDLGAVGTADRWADLAVASMSLGWNFGAGWEALFFESYGTLPDARRIAYYRRLWSLS